MKILAGLVTAALLCTPVLAAPARAAETDFAPMALNSFSTLPKKIDRAIVVDQNGQAIGIVRAVQSDSSGKPGRVEVMMPGGQTIAIGASLASYDTIANRVIADNGAVREARAALSDHIRG